MPESQGLRIVDKLDVVAQALQRLLDSGVLGRSNRPRTERFAALLGGRTCVPLAEVLRGLWPRKREAAALGEYRNYKLFLNTQLANAGINLVLANETDNRPAAVKNIWFEVRLSAEEQQRLVVVKAVEQLQPRDHHDTPAHQYVEQYVVANLPLVNFPGEMDSFARQLAPEHWDALDADARSFLARLSTKLEPIIQLAPPMAVRPVLGFECLALGPQAEPFMVVCARAGDCDKGVLRFLMAYAQLLTANTLCSDAQNDGQKRAGHLRFTLNLDSHMIDSPYMDRFLELTRSLRGPNVCFEVNEDVAARHVPRLKELKDREKLCYLADDYNGWQNVQARALIGDHHNEMVKIDQKTFRKLADDHGRDPVRLIAELRVHAEGGKPMIVEGVESDTELDMLEKHWPPDSAETLYAQGYAVAPGQPWDAWTSDLREFGFGGGHILANPFLAEVNRVVRTCLESSHSAILRREYRGGLYRITVPKFGDEQASLTLAVLSNHTAAHAVAASHWDGVDYLVGQQWLNLLNVPGHGGLGASSFWAPPVDQCLLRDLPRLLSAYHRAQKAADSLPGSLREHDYPATKHTEQDVQGNNGTRENALNFLIGWLRERNVPFCGLLGDYGTGKTFTCRMLRNRLIDERTRHPELPLPLYFDLRELQAKQQNQVPTLEEMLEALLKNAGLTDLPIDGLLAAVRHGDVLLIFDGLDEKTCHLRHEQASAFLRAIRGAVPAEARERGKVLVACRTHYFYDIQDENSRLRGGGSPVTKSGWQEGHFRVVYLQPFDETRIKRFISLSLGEPAVEPTYALICAIHNLRELAERPFLLALILHYLDRIKELGETGKHFGAADVYQTFVQEWLARIEDQHKLPPHVKVAFMEALAQRMWQSETRQLHYDRDLRHWVQAQLSTQFPTVSSFDDALLIDTDVRSATFVKRDDEGNYHFAHTSFLEFFLARGIARRLSQNDAGALKLPRLNRETIEFLADLLQRPEYDAQRAAGSVSAVLEAGCTPVQSENAVLLLAHWQRMHLDTAPRPSFCHLDGADLAGADLSRLELGKVALAGANLENADLARVRLVGPELADVTLAGANLANANLTEAHVHGDLSAANLAGIRAANADFSGSRLLDVQVTAADLAGARLRGCDLTRAHGDAVFLQRADLSGVNMESTRFPSIRLHDAVLDPNVLASAQWPEASFRVTALDRLNLVPQVGHASVVRAIAVHPTGRWLASGAADGTIKIWETATGLLIQTLAGHAAAVHTVAFAPDGRTLASGSADGTVRLWDSATGKVLSTLANKYGVNAIAFAPDGRTLASGCADGTVRLWDSATGKALRTLAAHDSLVYAVAFAPDGRTLASGSDDKTVRLGDLASGKAPRTLIGHDSRVYAVAFAPDGRTLASGSDDKTVRLWDPATGKALRTFAGHADWVRTVAFAPDGRTLASGSDDGTVRLWDPGTRKALRTLAGHEDWVYTVAFTPDGRTLTSGSADKTVRLWDPATGKAVRTLAGHESWVSAVAFAPDGRTQAAGAHDSTVRLWEPAAGKDLRTLAGHEALVYAVTFAPDGRTLASGSADRTVRLWEPATGKVIRTIAGHEHSVYAVAFAPDGRILASGDDKTLRLWDPATGNALRTFIAPKSGVHAVKFAPDGRTLASGSDDGTVWQWDPATRKALRPLVGHESRVHALAFAPNGRTLASGSNDKTVRLWDPATGNALRTLAGHENGVQAVAFAPDGRTLASGSADRTVRLWVLATGNAIRTLLGHEAPVRAVAYAPDGRTLVSGGADGTVRLWDVATSRLLATLILGGDGSWLTYVEDGFFDCSERLPTWFGFRDGMVVYPAAEFAAHFRRPDLVVARLAHANSSLAAPT